MPSFNANQGAFTPSVSNDNWTLDFGVTAGTFGKIVMINWGGRLTTSTGYRTRWTRPTAAGTGARTNLTLQFSQPNYAAAGGVVTSTYATTQPTLPADPANLWGQDWNAQGGVGAIAMPLANPWWAVNGVLTGAISCRNVAGLDANGSSYGLTWEE